MKLFDYNMFRQDSMVETMLTISRIIRKKVPNKLSALFYGYITIADYKGAANPGHFGLGKVLASKDVDILCGPVSYHRRDLGYGGMTPGSTESVTRSGKIWISEDDIRTHRVPQTQSRVSKLGKELRTLEDTLSVLQRDMAQQAIRNNGCWWMDLGGTGWYDDPELWKLMPKFASIEKDMIENPVPYEPEVALIMDERSVCFGGAGGTNLRTMRVAGSSRVELTVSAVPFGNYLLDDFLFGKPAKPKLAIFTVSCALDKKQREAIREKTKDSGAMFIWATGLIDADNSELSLESASRATGFEMKYTRDRVAAHVISRNDGKAAGLPPDFGVKKETFPLLTPVLRKGDKVLALYENGEPAIVLRGKKLFSGIDAIPSQLYGLMLKLSGVHLYSKQPLCVFANGAYVSVTCIDSDNSPHDIELSLPRSGEIFDAFTGKLIGNGKTITLKMKRGDNCVLRMGKGNADILKDKGLAYGVQ